MRATGIIRRIDELGRIVIPKEIRRTFRIKVGTPLEIFCGDEGELILKKYSMIMEIKHFASEVCQALHNTLNLPIIITDKDEIICSYGQKNIGKGKISAELDKVLENRNIYIKNKLDNDIMINFFGEDKSEYFAQIVVPIIANGDIVGSIICFSKDQIKLDNSKAVAIKVMANFLAEQIC